MKVLIIVESPTKAKTLKKHLQANYIVSSSFGHIIDLPISEFGIDIQNGFKPKFVTMKGKQKVINNLKKYAKNMDTIYLATDADREGEAISYHLSTIFPKALSIKRIILREYTPKAIRTSLSSPKSIDVNLVEAQFARRLLDRIVGYKMSPYLWDKIQSGLSAGRVQSVALKWICERDNEIINFISEEFWELTIEVQANNLETFRMQLKSPQDTKIQKKIDMDKIVNELKEDKANDLIITEIKKEKKIQYPPPPFTTSTLQKSAHRILGFTTNKTMKLAQELYEGVDLQNGYRTGLITYMRTDSTRVSHTAHQSALDYINNQYGKNYCARTFNVTKNKPSSQDAHEAIRPVDINITPISVRNSLSKEQYKLYELIWKRFLASRMSGEDSIQQTITAKKGKYTFVNVKKMVIFDGFTTLQNKKDKNEKLPSVQKDDILKILQYFPEQKHTNPPSHFTDASLVDKLEKTGIGRPSTYSTIIETLIKRKYIIRKDKKFFSTELGNWVNQELKAKFSEILEDAFTADIEKQLDKIENGELKRLTFLTEFYDTFQNLLKNKNQIKQTPNSCPMCKQGELKSKISKKGKKYFICSRFPKCEYTTYDVV